jgi:hypothetical protein
MRKIRIMRENIKGDQPAEAMNDPAKNTKVFWAFLVLVKRVGPEPSHRINDRFRALRSGH